MTACVMVAARWLFPALGLGLLGSSASCGTASVSEPGGPSGASCPHATPDDIWIDKRIGCLAPADVGSPSIAKATGPRADRAFILAQQTLDSGFNNVLGSGNSRYFKYAVCVRDVGEDAATPSFAVPFAGDLVVAFRVMSAHSPEIGSSTLRVASQGEPAVAAQPCDPTSHPIILAADGTVESANPAAVPALTIVDGR